MRPPRLDCWTGGFSEALCCDLRLSPEGRKECWAGPFDYANCCPQPVSDPYKSDKDGADQHEHTPCERAFRDCSVCSELRSAPRFGRDSARKCVASGLTLWAAQGRGELPYAVCLPRACEPTALQPQNFAVLDLASCHVPPLFSPRICVPSVLFVICLLPSFGSLLSMPCKRHRTASVPNVSPHRESRDPAVDLLRVVGTVAAVAQHLNTRVFWNGISPVRVEGLQGWLPRLQDSFGVASAVLHARALASSKSELAEAGGALDKVWRKLSRQLPLYLFPVSLFSHAACPRPASCLLPEFGDGSSLSAQLLLRVGRGRGGNPEDPWPFAVDLWIQLVLLACSALVPRIGSVMTFSVLVATLAFVLASAMADVPDYYSFRNYRLPMALFVYLVAVLFDSRLPFVTPASQRQSSSSPHMTSSMSCFKLWALRLVVAVLVCIGLSVDPLAPANADFSRSSFLRFGRDVGLSVSSLRWFASFAFHLGLLGITLPNVVPRSLLRLMLPRWFVDICFAVLLVHVPLHEAAARCERPAEIPWQLVAEAKRGASRADGAVVTMASAGRLDADASVAALSSIVVVASSMLFGVLAVGVVQRPWEQLLAAAPRLLRRAVCIVFIACVLVDCYSRGELI
eukprot:TRINITY_DN19732_c0_g1_i1.p1 TRINITY_DN19732_c0_g1~~TRINITY_DN19732_c0_g1_i1.p1  ORF type:complete len:709 (-),score=77.19 TRINITY_DN19732_c0_g1_i1:10-1890(-)